MGKRTILMYGRSGSGKTAQIGALAEHVFKTTGKRTRLYTGDRGGIDTIRPHVNLGVVDVEEMRDTDPWIFLNKAARGFQRDAAGKWVPGKNDDIGCFAFESMRAFAEALMASMVQKTATGVNIGGGSNVSFNVGGDGESLKVSGSNMSMFGIAQQRMTDEIWESQRLDAPYVVWTSAVSKDDDLAATGKVLGPDVIGKALTTEVPRWFTYTFRLDVLPARDGKGERHILYTGNSIDVNAGNTAGLGNSRTPLDAPALPASIEPASIVKALELIDGGGTAALEALKKRLGNSLTV